MTAPLPRRKQHSILRMYLEGLSFDQIADHAGVGKGSVVEVVRRMKSGAYEEYQDTQDIVDDLRDIALFVRKEFSGDLQRCHDGALALVSLNRLGIDPAKLPEFVRLCEYLAPSEATAKEFAEIAMWARRLQNALDIPLPELPQYVESLTEKVKSLLEEREGAESEAQAAKTSSASLREELGLLQDIKGLRSARREEESRLTEAQSNTKAALAAAEVTSKGLEQFRVFAGATKATGVSVDGALFDTLLGLIESLGPQGIREVDTLRRLLAREGISAAEGASLLTGLRQRGFTLGQAAEVARALADGGSFPDAVARLTSQLHEHGTLEAALAASKLRIDELSKQEATQRAESENLTRSVAYQRGALEDLARQAQQASKELEGIRAETQKAVAEGEAQQKKNAEEMRRLAGVRESFFGEWADLLTPRDYELLGNQMKGKGSSTQVPELARWILTLLAGQGVLMTRPRLAPDDKPMRGVDGAIIEETGTVTLSRPERLRLRELVHRASLEGEGLLHAIVRITSGPPDTPPQETDGSADEDGDAFSMFVLRHLAKRDLNDLLGGVFEGRIGRLEPPPGGRASNPMGNSAPQEPVAETPAQRRGGAPPEAASATPKATADPKVSGLTRLDDVLRAILSPSLSTPVAPTRPLPAQTLAAGQPALREGPERPRRTPSFRRRSCPRSKGVAGRAPKRTSAKGKNGTTLPSSVKSKKPAKRHRHSGKRDHN